MNMVRAVLAVLLGVLAGYLYGRPGIVPNPEDGSRAGVSVALWVWCSWGLTNRLRLKHGPKNKLIPVIPFLPLVLFGLVSLLIRPFDPVGVALLGAVIIAISGIVYPCLLLALSKNQSIV